MAPQRFDSQRKNAGTPIFHKKNLETENKKKLKLKQQQKMRLINTKKLVTDNSRTFCKINKLKVLKNLRFDKFNNYCKKLKNNN